ncbi:MAG: hypothetical protein ACLUZZ_06165 [Alistipes inops]
MKILFMADFSITASDILENKKVFDSYEDVEVDVIEVIPAAPAEPAADAAAKK